MFTNLGLQQTIRTTLGDKLVSAYRPCNRAFPEVTPMWILTLNRNTHPLFYVQYSNHSRWSITALSYSHHWQLDEAQAGRFIGVL